MTDSIAFDQAAEYYDATRALPPDVHAAMIDLVVPELEGSRSALEIGVGTGRVALSLHERGIPMIGADLSEPMLRRLVANASGSMPFPLVRADATVLPFHDRSFDASVVCHVLHLIPRWRDAVGELVRVVRPGGVLLFNVGAPPTPVGRAIAERFEAEVGQGPLRPGLTEPEDLDDALAAIAPVRILETVTHAATWSVAELLERYEKNELGVCWRLEEHVRRRAVAATRAWAEATYDDVTSPEDADSPIVWRVYDLE